MTDAALTMLKVGLLALSVALAFAAANALAAGQALTGLVLLLLLGAVAFVVSQLG